MTTTPTFDELPHGDVRRARGSRGGGRPRCFCGPCRKVERAYTKQRLYLAHTGQSLLIDAAPARDHLRQLMAQGDALVNIAKRIGRPRCTLVNVANGRNKKITRGLAAQILSVPAGTSTACNLSVPALGSTRRIRALVAAGHSLKSIQAAVGMQHTAASYLLKGTRQTIHYELAQRVKAGYRQLSNTRGGSARSLRRAEREGWPPPAAWDDEALDDPTAEPATVAEMDRRELAEYRRQEIAHLASFNVPEHEIAARLGMGDTYVHDLIRDMRKAA